MGIADYAFVTRHYRLASDRASFLSVGTSVAWTSSSTEDAWQSCNTLDDLGLFTSMGRGDVGGFCGPAGAA